MDAAAIDLLRRRLDLLIARNQHWAQRFLAQMDFVQGLIDLTPDRKDEWTKLQAQAWQAVADAVGGEKVELLPAAVRDAERILEPVAKAAKQYTIHCVAHAHIDMNWMWSWPETVAVVNDTFTTMLQLMEEFPEFCYTQSQASVYDIVLKYCPDLVEPSRRRIAEGRWEVAAAHWVEGDKNLASGESLARHLLYARRFLAEQFGVKIEDSTLDWEPDTFGHAVTVPAIDSRGGVKYYYMCRGGQFAKPPVFWYQSPDGSRILVNLEQTWYLNRMGTQLAGALVKFAKTTGLKAWMNVYGVGDHGGGPTRKDILLARDMDSWPVYPRFEFSTARRFFKLLEESGKDWPVLERELNFEFTGCYTSQSAIKHNNRFGENYCVEAEAAAAIAGRAVGRKYPAQEIRDAWIPVLFSHFHDILPGSGVHYTREYNQAQFQEVAAATGMIKTQSLRSLAAAVDTSFASASQLGEQPAERESNAMGAGVGYRSGVSGVSAAAHVHDGPRPFVAMNLLGQPRREVVTLTVWDAETGSGTNAGDLRNRPFRIRRPDGTVEAAQTLNTGHFWAHSFVELAVPVEVGPLGYAAVAIEEGSAAAPAADSAVTVQDRLPGDAWNQQPVGRWAMSNEHLTVEFDSLTGGIVRLVDKASGADLASKCDPMGVLEYLTERPRGMSAWVIGDTMRREGPLAVQSIQATQRGPYVGTIEMRTRAGESDIVVSYTLRAGQPWVEIAVKTTWVQRGTAQTGIPHLAIRFPMALDSARGRYEIPFGTIRRNENAGQDVPTLRWADVSGQAAASKASAGCAVLNDSKYGCALDGSTLTVRLIRSSYEPDPLPEIGEHEIRLAVAPYGGTKSAAELIRWGSAFNHPLQIASTTVHAGKLPAADCGASVGPDSVILSSVKKAEDDDCLIFRLYETAGQDADAEVKLGAKLLGKAAEAVEVDLLERPLAKSSAKASASGFTVRVPAFGLVSVKVKLK